jgi:hypothetical protein
MSKQQLFSRPAARCDSKQPACVAILQHGSKELAVHYGFEVDLGLTRGGCYALQEQELQAASEPPAALPDMLLMAFGKLLPAKEYPATEWTERFMIPYTAAAKILNIIEQKQTVLRWLQLCIVQGMHSTMSVLFELLSCKTAHGDPA